MDKTPNQPKTTLNRWIWNSFWKTAIIPLVVVELAFVFIYFSANNWSQLKTVDYLKDQANTQLSDIARSESKGIQNKLESITHYTTYFQMETQDAHHSQATLSPQLASRMKMTDYGAYVTFKDSAEGGAAVFYSGAFFVGEKEKVKLGHLMVMEEEMIDLLKSEPMISSLYYNTFDSLNIIYPYFDVLSQYPVKMDIPTYNFYYEADLAHNPDRGVEWTDVYLDPAGHGWMASAIAPVYTGDFLEGVVGIDVTVDTFANSILNLDIPWDGYAILVDEGGTILALPKQGETDWGLREITDHTYSEAILEDTFKPEAFNIYNHVENANTLVQIKAQDSGLTQFTLNGETKTAAWSTIPETGWKLFVLVSPTLVTAQVDTIKSEILNIGLFMLAGIFIFYLLFFIMLATRARKMSDKISQPLKDLNEMVAFIGQGHYNVEVLEQPVIEFEDTAKQLALMGRQLGATTQALTESELRYNLALEGAEAGLWDWDMVNDQLYFSPLFKKIVGYADDELEASREAWRNLIHPDERPIAMGMIQQIRDGKLNHLEVQVRMLHKNGDWIWVSTRGGAILNDKGQAIRLIGTNTDITPIMQERLRNVLLQENLNLKESHLEELKEVTLRDPLTNVYNRRYLETIIQDDIVRAHLHHSPLTMAIIDLDHFKRVNDTWGHDVGDDQLNFVSKLIQQSLRESDAVIRFGGEEFVIVFRDTDLAGAKEACEKVRKTIDAQVHPITGHQSVSIGLAQLKEGETLTSCLKRADEAMYVAKHKGRNRVESL